MMWKRLLGAVCALTIWSGAASGATLKAMDLEDLTAGADRVITGQVAEVKARWSEGLIITSARITIDTCLVGPCETEVVVETVGGQVGDLVMSVDGMARFAQGEEVLLFLQRPTPNRQSAWRTRGMAQGKFSIRRVGAQVWLERPLGAVELVGVNAREALAVEGASLSDVTTRVKHLKAQP
ncbi:MAG: hypothetical protein ACE366_06405 [Bradymonadia bacterium]